jgi:uncharacterized protein YdaU (DUF1376 family)
MNYYEHHLGDYAKDTAHLSILEHGAYRLLLDRYYGTEQGIPDDQAHRFARARTREERQAVDTVLKEFFTLVDGLWINRRAEEEIAKARTRIGAAKDNGKRGGRPKKKPEETQNKPSGFSLGSEIETQNKPTGFSPGSEIETQTKALQTPDTKHQTPIEDAADTRARDCITESMQAELFAAAGNSLNLPASPDLQVMARPLYWLQQGADWNLDIIPTIKLHATKGRPYTIRSWNYFDGPIADAMARRTRPMPKGNADERASGAKAAGDHRYTTAVAGLAASGDF